MNISVVIATYNRAPLLRVALEQLRRQQYRPDDEVIIVNNGSTDDTAEVVARAADGFPVALRQLVELTPGKTPALNAGIAAARGAVIALTDDDVLVGGDWIATIRQVFTTSPVALVGGRVDPNWERPAPKWLRVEQHDPYGQMCAPLALLHYGAAQDLGGRTAIGGNMAVLRRVLEELGGFAPHLGRQRGTLLCGEDHEFSQRAVAAGYRCEYRPELCVKHWVPAERARLRYYLRWFFWSGVTHAVLRSTDTPASTVMRRLLSAPVASLVHVFRGRPAEAAARAMDGAFGVGYIWHRMRDQLQPRRAHEPRQHVAGHAQSPEIPGPRTQTQAVRARKAGVPG